MQVPGSWSEVTLRQYQAAHQVLSAQYDEPLDRHVALIAALTNSTEDHILSLPIRDITDSIQRISFLFDLGTINRKFPRIFVAKGRAFRIIQRLEKCTGGQYIDLNTFLKNGDVIGNLHNLMAVICLPLFSKYEGRAHQKRAAFLLDNMTMDVAYPVALFFWTAFSKSIPSILENLREKASQTGTRLENALAGIKY